jgi:hypothetical protein
VGEVFEEADIRMGLKDGGEILGAFIVARSDEDLVVYLRGSWVHGRGFRIIRSYRGWTGDRSFKKLDSAWAFIKKFGYAGHVTIYPVGDPKLRQFMGVAPQDLETPIYNPAGSPILGTSTVKITAPAGSIAK